MSERLIFKHSTPGANSVGRRSKSNVAGTLDSFFRVITSNPGMPYAVKIPKSKFDSKMLTFGTVAL
jgi:hypothetical protein